MTLTAVLPADVDLPEETWLPARVRRHGKTLEVEAQAEHVLSQPVPDLLNSELTSDQTASAQRAYNALRAQLRPPLTALTDEDLDEARWQYLKAKHLK